MPFQHWLLKEVLRFFIAMFEYECKFCLRKKDIEKSQIQSSSSRCHPAEAILGARSGGSWITRTAPVILFQPELLLPLLIKKCFFYKSQDESICISWKISFFSLQSISTKVAKLLLDQRVIKKEVHLHSAHLWLGCQVLGKEVGRDHGVSVDTCAAIFKVTNCFETPVE